MNVIIHTPTADEIKRVVRLGLDNGGTATLNSTAAAAALSLSPGQLDHIDHRWPNWVDYGFGIGIKSVHIQRNETFNRSTRTLFDLKIAPWSKDPRYSEYTLTLSYGNQHDSPMPEAEQWEFLTAVTSILRQADFRLSEAVESTALAEIYQARDAQLSKTQQTLENIITESADRIIVHHRKLDAEFRRARELEQELRESAAKKLDEDRQRQREELEQARSDFEKSKADYDQRLAEIDDSDAKYARRERREKLQSAIKERFNEYSLTTETKKTRVPTYIACTIGTLATIGVIIHALYTGPPEAPYPAGVGGVWQGSAFVLYYLRLVGAAAGFYAILNYFIKWSERWSDQHAREEFQLRKLATDIDRAEWLAETVFEFQEANPDHELPDLLIERLSRGLFVDEPDKKKESPHIDLASLLLGNAATLELMVGQNKLAFDKKAIKKIQKSNEDKNN